MTTEYSESLHQTVLMLGDAVKTLRSDIGRQLDLIEKILELDKIKAQAFDEVRMKINQLVERVNALEAKGEEVSSG